MIVRHLLDIRKDLLAFFANKRLRMLANPLRIKQIDYNFLDKKFATLIVK